MSHTVKGVIRRIYQQHSLARCMCNYPKATGLYQEARKPETDLLLDNIKASNDTKNILEIVGKHSGIMNGKHIAQALRSLFILQKQGSAMSTRELLSNKDFHRLCTRLKIQAGTIELNDTLDALKTISYVGVPSDSSIVQVLLQLLRQNINALSLQQIIFLDFLLQRLNSSPLVDALKIALPIVFELNLPLKMNTDNQIHLTDYLFFLSKFDAKEDSIRRVAEALLTFEDFDGKSARGIIWSLCEIPGSDVFKSLMGRAIEAFMRQERELSNADFDTTLNKLTMKYNKYRPYCYHQRFYDLCAKKVIEEDQGFKHGLYTLWKFQRINYFHAGLLDYVSEKVQEDTSLVSRATTSDIYTIATSIAMTEYRPVHWTLLRQLIKYKDLDVTDKKEIIWLKFGAALCLLNIFKDNVLKKALNENVIDRMFKHHFAPDFELYCTIWGCINSYKPELKFLLPSAYSPEAYLQGAKPTPLPFSLEGALQRAIGDASCVKTDLYSKHGQQIDHVVVFRKGGYPVAFNPNDTLFIEDLEVPHDHQLVVVLGLRPFNYTVNYRKLRSGVGLQVKLLEASGVHVVPICLEVWEELGDFEKIPYLMQAIKERTREFCSVSEGVI